MLKFSRLVLASYRDRRSLRLNHKGGESAIEAAEGGAEEKLAAEKAAVEKAAAEKVAAEEAAAKKVTLIAAAERYMDELEEHFENGSLNGEAAKITYEKLSLIVGEESARDFWNVRVQGRVMMMR